MSLLDCDVKCLVPISGGKDSQCCLELALHHFPRESIRGLFCDTKWEHPITYAHIDWMRKHYGVQIDVVCGGSVMEKSVKYGRFPGGGARHCTDELKIRETKIYCKELAERQGQGFEVWYGMRSGESDARRKRYSNKISTELYPPHEVIARKYPKYLAAMGVLFRLPILDWSKEQVLHQLGGRENPLYELVGVDRVGCFPCMAAGDATKEKCFAYDEFGAKQYATASGVAITINKPIWTSKKGRAKYEFQGCAICAI